MGRIREKLTVRFPSPQEKYDPLNEATFRQDLERLLDRIGGNLGGGAPILVIVPADTTPNVSLGDYWTVTQGGAISITAFPGAQVGQQITIVFTDGNTTIVDGANLHLAGGANFVGSADDILVLLWDGTHWYEVSRSVN
jgi:hypothetical protein